MSENVIAGNPFVARKRSCYYVKVTLIDPVTGKQRHLKKSTNIRIDAVNALSKAHNARLAILAEYETNHDPAAPLTLKDFADRYLKEREAENLTRSSLRGIRLAFDELGRFVGKKRLLTSINASDLRGFLFKAHESASMALVNYRYLHAAFDRAVRDEKLTANPLNQIDKKLLRKRFTPRPRGILSAKAVVSIYDYLPKDEFCERTYANYFLFLFGTACRRSEACYMKEKHVDMRSKIIRVIGTEQNKLKTEASTADIPITEHAMIALRDQSRSKTLHPSSEVRSSPFVFCNFRGEHYFPDTLTKQVILRVKRACKALGINSDGVDLHSLRHSLIQYLIDSGAEPVVVSKFARHANLSTTLGAYHKMKDTKSKYESVLKVTKAMPVPKELDLT